MKARFTDKQIIGMIKEQEDYNWRRPHSALGNPNPMEFLQRKVMDKMAA